MKNREPIFDMMKGIGIILMLIGHIPPRINVYHFIYSFHMPLFFIVSGWFASIIQSQEDGRQMFRKDVQRLLFPVVITMLFVILMSPLHYITDGNFHYVVQETLSLFWAGDALHTKWGVLNSPMWFLISLFWVRFAFRIVERFSWRQSRRHDELVLILSIIISVTALLLHRFLPFPTPWGILKGMTALVFYSIGWYIKRNGMPLALSIGLVIAWFFALRYGFIDMYYYRYDCYPLDVLGAVGATWLVYLLCKGICSISSKSRLVLQWFGVNSLLIFCIQCLDRRTYLVRIVKAIIERVFDVNIHGGWSVLLHYSIEMLLVVLVLYIPFLKSIYGAKRLKEIR